MKKETTKRKKNPNMARHGPNNGRWRGGKSKTFYRKHSGCKTNDGKLVHHTKRKRKGSKKIPFTKDYVIILDNRGNSARAKHNKEHPEKGGRR